MSEQMIFENLQKEQKLIARKKLYFAISIAFGHAWKQFTAIKKAMSIAKLAMHQGDCDCGQCAADALTMIPELMKQQAAAVRALYCIADACEGYQVAFGDYPEFAQFLVKPKEESNVPMAEFLKKVKELADVTENEFSALGKRFGFKKPFPSISRTAFGDQFVQAAQKTKLKGEV